LVGEWLERFKMNATSPRRSLFTEDVTVAKKKAAKKAAKKAPAKKAKKAKKKK
jgi:hypothetical protein